MWCIRKSRAADEAPPIIQLEGTINEETQTPAVEPTDVPDRNMNLDVRPNNILPTGIRRNRQPPAVNPDYGYEFIEHSNGVNISDAPTVNEYLNVMTTYVNTLNSYSEVNNLIQYAAQYLVLTQMTMIRGLKVFGQAGVGTIDKEMKQLHDSEVV